MTEISLTVIRGKLGARIPALQPPGSSGSAAVALILRETARGPEVLFIERARFEGDPWSGHLGFPGGRVEREDEDPQRAAERETAEEIGLDLRIADCLGQLDDLTGAYLPVLVSCFVYAVRQPGSFVFSDEVVDAFWFPLAELMDPRRRLEARFFFRGEHMTHPALRLLEPDRPLLWGITYRLVSQFLEILGCTIPCHGEDLG